jgi:hypothetical protein
MSPISNKSAVNSRPQASAVRGDVWHALVQQATHLMVSQMDAFLARLANALLAASEQLSDAKDASLNFSAGQMLKNNGYSFYYLASAAIEASFRHEIQALLAKGLASSAPQDAALSLVSFEEMDTKLAFGRASRHLELASAESLLALNMRLATLTEFDTLSIAQNPFRPDVFLKTMQAVWCEFHPDPATHHLILPLLRTTILFDLEPIYQALNDILVARGVLPDLQDSFRIKKTTKNIRKEDGVTLPGKKRLIPQNNFAQKLKKYFSDNEEEMYAGDGCGSFGGAPQHEDGDPDMRHQNTSYRVVDSKLFQYLANLQKSMALSPMTPGAPDVMHLSQIREQMPELVSSSIEKTTLDLLSKIFDTVFLNQDIPRQIKELISLLQIPVLKAALMDKEFFFQEAHPARRLIDLLSKYSVSVDQEKGQSDPLFQNMKASVSRVQQEFDQHVELFDVVVSDLENFVAREEAAIEEALQAPITQALQKEKFKQANFHAKNEVALRVRTGEVLAFVETFLENRWIKVLTLAYSVKEDKPQAVADAIKTMDDLIWSVKPKNNLEQRQEMVNRLPAILVRLNKWLNLIKWEESDQLLFFTELAECHASIVRAPLDLSPERQLEIAVEVAQQAAERRLVKRAQEESGLQAESEIDLHTAAVANLERGIWLQFTKKDASTHNVRLAWVSPMRSLYIFTSSQREKSFSVSTEELEQSFRENRVQILILDKVVDRALMAALEDPPLHEEPVPD